GAGGVEREIGLRVHGRRGARRLLLVRLAAAFDAFLGGAVGERERLVGLAGGELAVADLAAQYDGQIAGGAAGEVLDRDVHRRRRRPDQRRRRELHGGL